MQLRYDTGYIGRSHNAILRLVPNDYVWSAALIYEQADLVRVWSKVGTSHAGPDGREGSINTFLNSNRFSKDHFTFAQADSSEYDDYIKDQAEKISTPGEVIYFIAVSKMNRIKIGITNNMASRFTTLKCAIPFSLNILAVANISHAEERNIQSLFSGVDLNNEWFELTPDIEEYIASLNQQRVAFPSQEKAVKIESLPLKNYQIYKSRQSVMDKDATITELAGTICPRCKNDIGILRNNEGRQCPKCKLVATVHNDILKCTIVVSTN